MARKHGGFRLAAVVVLSYCAVLAPTAASAGAITVTSFSGPTNLLAGMQGTYQLEVELLGIGTTTVTDVGGGLSVTSIVGYPTFSFNSAEGEIVSMSPLSSPFSGLYSTGATFTFENPGSYLVFAGVSVTTQNQQRQVVHVPVYTFDSNCNCTVLAGYQQQTTYTSSSVVESAGGSLLVTVSPQPVPDAASTLLLLGASAVSLVWMRRRAGDAATRLHQRG